MKMNEEPSNLIPVLQCPVGERLKSSDKYNDLNGQNIVQYPENAHKTIEEMSVVDNHSISVECTVRSGLNYQVEENENMFSEMTGYTSQKLEFNKCGPLQDILQNQATVDYHLAYYDEIIDYIRTRTFPENSSLSYKILLKKRAKNYSVKDGTLFYGTKRVLKTKLEQLQMLENTHVEEKTGVHLGVKKMSQIINVQYFWRGQYVDIANFVRQCSKCTEQSESSSTSKENVEHDVIEELTFSGYKIWQKVELYLHGPYSKIDGQSVFIATIVDPVSRYVVARLVGADNCSVHLSYFILDTFCTFGVVKCYFSEMCKQYLDAVKLALRQQDNFIQKVKLPCHQSLQDFLFPLPQGEEECLWIQSCLEPYVNNFLPLCERDLCVYIFELNTKITNSSPFIRMFNRQPYSNLEDNKENANINREQIGIDTHRISQRRLLRSSVLQCRHCEEVFTSKISFRIHQRKHTEEAHRRGMLEGQIKCLGNRERRMLQRPLSKHKPIAVKRRSNLQSVARHCINSLEERCQSSMRVDVPEHRRAELRASTVEAVRRLVAKTRDNRKCRGKYKKFPSEIQEQMARYAVEHGSLLTVRHFSEKMGVIVSESTVRNIVKWYQCFTPEIKDEIGRFAAAFGVEAAASHFSERLGREVRFGLIRKFKKVYLSQVSNTKQVNSEKKTEKINTSPKSGVTNTQSDATAISPTMKETIGHYATEHTIPLAIDHFSQQFNLNLKEHVVRKCRKLYQDKQKSGQQQKHQQQQQQQRSEAHQPQLYHQQQTSVDQHHQLSLNQVPEGQQRQLLQQKQQPQHEQQQHHQQHFQHLQQQQQPLHQQQLQQQHQQLQEEAQQPSGVQHESLHCDANGVALLSLQHQTNSSNIQENAIQSSSQTIDILQTSLNLLNNPQLNNSTAIIYNTPYQMPSTSHVPSNQLISLNQQQNPPITFQTTNQCSSSSNIPTSVPLAYQPQDAPISASVIINQNVATVQTFPNTQMYPAFAQTHSIQPTTLTVSDNSLHLPPTGTQIPSLPHPPPLPTHSGLPTITVAVAPLPTDPHFQTASNQPTVVLSQPVPQPILVSHSQSGTTLLQHIIDPQSHLQPTPAQMSQHLISEVHANTNTSQTFHQVIEQQHPVCSGTYPHALESNIPAVTYETPTPFVNENGNSTFTVSTNTHCAEGLGMKRDGDYTEQLQNFESQVSLTKITDGTDSNMRTSLLISEGISSQCPLVSDGGSTKGETGSAESSALKMDCPKNSSVGEQCETGSNNNCNTPTAVTAAATTTSTTTTTTMSCGDSKSRIRKSGRKKEKKVVCRGKSKVIEQKRGTYAIYSPEIRAEMGKYAAEHGSQKACDYFRDKHGYNVAESTMRGLRDKYLKKRELCSRGNDGEVTSLGYAPRGRPMRLGPYDEVVQECMQDLVKSGEKISSFLAIATAKHVLMQYEPHLLEENGGKIKLNVTWAKSFLKRSGIKNYS